MERKKAIGIVFDDDFALKNVPPYPHPTFPSYESPLRIKAIVEFLEKKNILGNDRIVTLEPFSVDESILSLAHTRYHIDSIKNFSNRGFGLLSEEIFITEDTYELAKKAVGGTIQAAKSVLNNEVAHSFALIRPPGHHALREKASGLCIFNNIANTILYLREELNYKKRIAIIDIDAHFGDGLVQYFYDDPNVLYFSIHEFDFVEGDIGFIDEIGEGEGLGKNINFPIPYNTSDDDFLLFLDILEPILNEFSPDLIFIAAGFDMYFDDPIGNELLTSISYYRFTERILKLANKICEGKLIFSLEGGYSLIGLPHCVCAVLKALLGESYKPPLFEKINFLNVSERENIDKIKIGLKDLLANYWASINK
ncbi:MAG: histone deacetylase family protein [Promethearchaeota archaeon]|jgi:acetoin utilization deacetylase AcuC-like enzyme